MKRPRCARVTEKIFDALCAHPYGLTNREIATIVYDGPDGGPGSRYQIWIVKPGVNPSGVGSSGVQQ